MSSKVRLDYVVNSKSAWVISVSENETHIKERKKLKVWQGTDVVHREEPKAVCVNGTKAAAWPYGPQDGNAELKV